MLSNRVSGLQVKAEDEMAIEHAMLSNHLWKDVLEKNLWFQPLPRPVIIDSAVSSNCFITTTIARTT